MAETKASGKKKKKAPASGRAQSPKKTKIYKSKDIVSDDSSDSSSGSDSEHDASRPAKSTTASKTKLSNSSIGSKPTTIEAKANGVANGKSTTSASSTDSDSDSDSESEPSSSNSTSDEEPADSGKAEERAKERVEDIAEEAIETSMKKNFGTSAYGNDYNPPAGYQAADGKAATPASITDMFSKSGIQGKQIWQISAPHNVPISELKQITMQAISKGQPVLVHKDASYGVSMSEDIALESVSMAVAAKGEYSVLSIPFSKSLHVQQIVKHDDIDVENIGTVETLAVAQRRYEKAPPPEQPQGLRMRHQPVGVIEKRRSSLLGGPSKRVKTHERHHGTTLSAEPEAAREAAAHKAKRKAEKAEKAARKEEKRLAKEAKKKSKSGG